MQEKEYLEEIKRLQEELATANARRQEAVSNYDLLVKKIKIDRENHKQEIKKYQKLIQDQNHTINLLNATMEDMKAGRI